MADIICPINSTQRVVSATVLSAGRISVDVAQTLRQVALTMQQNAKGGVAAVIVGTSSLLIPQTLAFANSNGVTFGLSGSTITASAAGGGGGQTLTFANSNNVSFGVQDGVVTGSASFSQSTLQVANSNGITLGLNGGTLTASHNALTTAAQSGHSHGVTLNLTNLSGTTGGNSAGINISLSASAPPAQTVQPVAVSGSNGSFVFSTLSLGNSNGLTFYSTNGSMVASHNALTTAMLSNAGTGFMSTSERANYFATAANTFANNTHSHGNPTLNLTNISGTTGSASNGLTLSLSAAAQSVQTQGSIQVQGSSGAISFGNANGITFGGNASTITASHNALTTAAQSDHSHGVTLNLTNLSGTTGGNSAGINISLSASAPPAQTVQTQGMVSLNGSTGPLSLVAASSISLSQNASTISVGLASNITTALQSAGAYLTTAMLSNAGTAFMSTSERANYFATAANTFANSTHSHGNPSLQLTNVSGTTASNSAGLTISLSAAAPGGGAAISAGTQSASTGTLVFSNSNGVSFGMSGSTRITASHNALTTAAQSNHSHGNPTLALTNIFGTTDSASNGLTISLSAAGGGGGAAIMISAGTTSGNVQTLVFSNGNGVSFGLNGSTVTASAAGGGGGGAPDRNIIEIIPGERLTTVAVLSASQFSQRPILQPFWVDGSGIICNSVRLLVSGGASSNRSLVMTFGVALYSANSNKTQLTLLGSDSQAFSITASSQSTVWNGPRIMEFTRMSSVTLTAEGRHVLAISCSAAGYNATYANMMVYGGDPMPSISGFMINGTTSATNTSSNIFPFWGVYSTTTNAFPASIGATQVLGGNSASLVDMYGLIKEI